MPLLLLLLVSRCVLIIPLCHTIHPSISSGQELSACPTVCPAIHPVVSACKLANSLGNASRIQHLQPQPWTGFVVVERGESESDINLICKLPRRPKWPERTIDRNRRMWVGGLLVGFLAGPSPDRQQCDGGWTECTEFVVAVSGTNGARRLIRTRCSRFSTHSESPSINTSPLWLWHCSAALHWPTVNSSNYTGW